MIATETPWAIDVRDVTKSFSGRTVVNHIAMQVKRGEIYGFLGPNGSGKTTFIRMLCGILNPDHAEGTCIGFDILRQRDEIKRRVGYMTQRFSLYDDLSAVENLDLIARLYDVKDRKKRIDEMVERMGLKDRRKQLTGTLSGGWKQRLALASCILHEPELLLLDEPTAGVDPKARREFWDELHNLAADGITALVSTHYMDEAERCHRLAYIAYGNLLTHGTIAEVIATANLATWTVRGDNLSQLAVELRRVPGVEQVVVFGETLHLTSSNHERLATAIVPFRQRSGLQWEEGEANIEDVFIYLSEKKAEDNFR